MVLLYTLKCRSPPPLLSAQHYKPPVDFLKGGLTVSQCISNYHIYGHWFVEKKFMYFRLYSYAFCISQLFGPAFAQQCAHLPCHF